MMTDKKVVVFTDEMMKDDFHSDIYYAAIHAKNIGADFFCTTDVEGMVKETYNTYAELYNQQPFVRRTVDDFLYWYEIKNIRIIVYDQLWGKETADVYIGETACEYFIGMCDYIEHMYYDFSRDAMVFTV